MGWYIKHIIYIVTWDTIHITYFAIIILGRLYIQAEAQLFDSKKDMVIFIQQGLKCNLKEEMKSAESGSLMSLFRVLLGSSSNVELMTVWVLFIFFFYYESYFILLLFSLLRSAVIIFLNN